MQLIFSTRVFHKFRLRITVNYMVEPVVESRVDVDCRIIAPAAMITPSRPVPITSLSFQYHFFVFCRMSDLKESAVRDGYRLVDLFEKIKARTAALDPKKYPHRTGKNFDTLRGDYKPPVEEQEITEKLLVDVKKRKQSSYSMTDWQKYGKYHTYRDAVKKFLPIVEEIEAAHLAGKTMNGVMSADRFDYRDVTYEWFVKNYEAPAKPCLISGFSDDWSINQFDFNSLANGNMKDFKVKVGKDDAGYRVGLRLRNYIHYVSENKDDSPVYLFESQLAMDDNIKPILSSYSRPVWFQNDFFDLVSNERRPPHRWLCLGPERSGTTMHTDPLNTNAWNTVIAGRKLWILFPPGTPEDVAKGTKFMPPSRERDDVDLLSEGIGWYLEVYPKLRKWIMDGGNKYGLQEFIQYPGETIFVPGSWWHFVINLDDTLAVTQNYVNFSNFPLVWRDMRAERRHVAKRWLHQLEKRNPVAFAMAIKFNKEDGWDFKFSKRTEGTQKPFEYQRKGLAEPPTLTMEELAKLQEEQKKLNLPFAYSGWENDSGNDDSSSSSDDSSSSEDEDDDDDKDEAEKEEEVEEKKGAGDSLNLDGNKKVSQKKLMMTSTHDDPSMTKVRNPHFATFVGDYKFTVSDLTPDVIEVINTIKRKKNPSWRLNSYSQHRIVDKFPALSSAVEAWAGLIEASALPAYVANPPPAVAKHSALPSVLTQSLVNNYLFTDKNTVATVLAAAAAAASSSSSASTSTTSSSVDSSAVSALMAAFQPIPRLHYKDISYEAWQEQYERTLKPCLLAGMTEGWEMHNYTADSLTYGKYRNVKFKVGKDSNGYRLTMKMRHYMQYLATTKDDAPLYLFESQLERIPVADEMQQDYVRPHFFRTDLFDLVDFNRRPPQRWLCVGPQNSGSHMHLDPLNTNAWNSLLHGRKYWLLLSPNVPENIAMGKPFVPKAVSGQPDPARHETVAGWFIDVLPKLRDFVAASKGQYVLHEVIQYPGETIFVPGNWWHAVLNLDDTLAITQNYCNESNFECKLMMSKYPHVLCDGCSSIFYLSFFLSISTRTPFSLSLSRVCVYVCMYVCMYVCICVPACV